MKRHILNLILLVILVAPQIAFADQLIIEGNEEVIQEVQLQRETLKAIHHGYGEQLTLNAPDVPFYPRMRLPGSAQMPLNTRNVDTIRESHRSTGFPMAPPGSGRTPR